MEQVKEKLEIRKMRLKKSDVFNLLKAFFISIIVVFSIAITFLHEYYPNSTKEYIEHKKKYRPIIDNRDKSFDDLLINLERNNITVQEYANHYRQIKKNSIDKLKAYRYVKAKIQENDSILGYTSFKNYLLGIGFPILGLINSVFFLFIIVKNVKKPIIKSFYLIISFSFIATWGYWVSWSNLSFTQDPTRYGDFPRLYYNLALFALPVIFSLCTYLLFNNLSTIEEKVSDIIKMFYKALYRDLPERKLIHPEKKKEFRIFRAELTRKAIENE